MQIGTSYLRRRRYARSVDFASPTVQGIRISPGLRNTRVYSRRQPDLIIRSTYSSAASTTCFAAIHSHPLIKVDYIWNCVTTWHLDQ